MKRYFLIIMASFTLFGCAAKQSAFVAGTEKTHVFHSNGTEVILPVPTGFDPSKHIDPRVKKWMTMMAPKVNAQAVYWTQDISSVEKEPDGSFSYRIAMGLLHPFAGDSPERFSQIQDFYRDQWESYIAKHPELYKSMENCLSKSLREDVDPSMNVEMGKSAMLGIIVDQPNTIGNLVEQKMDMVIQGVTHQLDCLLSTTTLLVNDNIVTIYMNSTSQGTSDVAWIKEKTREWADLILKANGEKGLES